MYYGPIIILGVLVDISPPSPRYSFSPPPHNLFLAPPSKSIFVRMILAQTRKELQWCLVEKAPTR